MNSVETYEGEFIEEKVARVVENKEPIEDGAPIIYTERKDGVIPAYNIRTDKWDIALTAMDQEPLGSLAGRGKLAYNKKPPYSLPFLMEYLTLLMADFSLHSLPGRVSIPAFSGRREMVDCLAMNYCILLERYAMLSSKVNDFSLETVSTIPS